jgi:hypothetical protein
VFNFISVPQRDNLTVTFKIIWFDHHREHQYAPDPAYPQGKDIQIQRTPKGPCQAVRVDLPRLPGVPVPEKGYCRTELPYPALRSGFYEIECQVCGFQCVVNTTGRHDDPQSIAFPCSIRPRL